MPQSENSLPKNSSRVESNCEHDADLERAADLCDAEDRFRNKKVGLRLKR